jgi:hypothetical protein
MKTKNRVGRPVIKVTMRLPENLVERAKIRAIKEHRTLQEIAAAALDAYTRSAIQREGGER